MILGRLVRRFLLWVERSGPICVTSEPTGIIPHRPKRDGIRTPEQWLNAIHEDMGAIGIYLQALKTSEYDAALQLALALREARRLQSDIYRYAEEALGISSQEIDQQNT